jgi:hypothetical protein
VAPSIDQNNSNNQKASLGKKEQKFLLVQDDPSETTLGKKNGRWNQGEKDKFIEGKYLSFI